MIMTEEDRTFRTIETGPIVKDKKIIGHHFYEGETLYFGIDDEEGMSSCTDWYIYPDGTFCYTTNKSWDIFIVDGDGTFDSSKYDEFVEQMMDCKTDWQKELKHNPWWYEVDEEGQVEREGKEQTDKEQGEREKELVKDEWDDSELPF